jgi:cytochrome b561
MTAGPQLPINWLYLSKIELMPICSIEHHPSTLGKVGMSMSLETENPSKENEGWKPVQRNLHWLTAGLIVLTVAIALYLILYPELPPSERGTFLWKLQYYLFNIHYVLGLAIVGTLALRLVFRLVYGSPPPLETIPGWQKKAAHVVHSLIYLNIIFMVAVGLIMIDAGGYWIWWKLWEWPVFPTEREHNFPLVLLMREFHFWGSISLLGLVALHIGAALKHHYIDRDTILRRLLPIRFRKIDG